MIFISQLISVQTSFHQMEVAAVLNAIDSLHKCNPLPAISIRNRVVKNGEACYVYDKITRAPLNILIDTEARFPMLSTIHELAHYLDHQAFGTPGTFASQDQQILPWSLAIERSMTVQHFKERRTKRSYTVPDYDMAIPLDQESIKDNCSLRELFAHSYTWYIALKCNNDEIRSELDRFQHDIDAQAHCPQWIDPNDFDSIADAFDQILRERGWKL